jgi:hypothetical protein
VTPTTAKAIFYNRLERKIDISPQITDLHSFIDKLGLPTPLPTQYGGLITPNGIDDDDGVALETILAERANGHEKTEKKALRVTKKIQSSHTAHTIFAYRTPTAAPTLPLTLKPNSFIDNCASVQKGWLAEPCTKTNWHQCTENIRQCRGGRYTISKNKARAAFSQSGMILLSGELDRNAELNVTVDIRKEYVPNGVFGMAYNLKHSFKLHSQAYVGVCKATAQKGAPTKKGDWAISSRGHLFADGMKNDYNHAPFGFGYKHVRVRYEPIEQLSEQNNNHMAGKLSVKVKWWIDGIEQDGVVLALEDENSRLHFCVGATINPSTKLAQKGFQFTKLAQRNAVRFKLR